MPCIDGIDAVITGQAYVRCQRLQSLKPPLNFTFTVTSSLFIHPVNRVASQTHAPFGHVKRASCSLSLLDTAFLRVNGNVELRPSTFTRDQSFK